MREASDIFNEKWNHVLSLRERKEWDCDYKRVRDDAYQDGVNKTKKADKFLIEWATDEERTRIRNIILKFSTPIRMRELFEILEEIDRL